MAVHEVIQHVPQSPGTVGRADRECYFRGFFAGACLHLCGGSYICTLAQHAIFLRPAFWGFLNSTTATQGNTTRRTAPHADIKSSCCHLDVVSWAFASTIQYYVHSIPPTGLLLGHFIRAAQAASRLDLCPGSIRPVDIDLSTPTTRSYFPIIAPYVLLKWPPSRGGRKDQCRENALSGVYVTSCFGC